MLKWKSLNSLYQSKPISDIYDDCEPPVDTSVYKCM